MEVVVVLLIVLFVVGAIWISNQKSKALRKAKQDYVEALAKLKRSPTDADIKQRTLALGRVYSNLTRNKKGISLFDEVALMNDINAACAAANVAPKQQTAPGGPAASVESRLRMLLDLKDKGLLAPGEYESRRSEILSSI